MDRVEFFRLGLTMAATTLMLVSIGVNRRNAQMFWLSLIVSTVHVVVVTLSPILMAWAKAIPDTHAEFRGAVWYLTWALLDVWLAMMVSIKCRRFGWSTRSDWLVTRLCVLSVLVHAARWGEWRFYGPDLSEWYHWAPPAINAVLVAALWANSLNRGVHWLKLKFN